MHLARNLARRRARLAAHRRSFACPACPVRQNLKMHRDPSLTFSETVARLEAEISELRALGGKRRERRLVAMTVISMVIGFHAVLGCIAMKVQADRFARDASKRLEGRSSDLALCAHRVDELTHAVDTSRALQCRGCAELQPTRALWTEGDGEK